MDVTDPTRTQCSSHIVFVSNEDGTIRFRVYSCKPNAAMIMDSYSISRMDECNDLLGDTTIILILDAKSRY